MFALEQLRADHGPAILEFELANRAYFAGSITDRGDDFFRDFAARHQALLDQQATGANAFYVLVDDDRAVAGRINLYEIGDGKAKLGYRVAQRVAGRGVATAAVRDICVLAARDHGVRTLRAVAADANVPSQKCC